MGYKILIISGTDLNMKTNGSAIVLLNYLKYIPKNFEIDLINLGKKYINNNLNSIDCININRDVNVFNIFISLNYNIYWKNKKIKTLISEKIKDNKYDLIYYHDPTAMMNYTDTNICSIGNFIDLHSLGSKYYFQTEKNFLKKIFFLKEILYCRYFEKKLLNKYKKIIMVNREEMKIANRIYHTNKFVDIPIGISISKNKLMNKKIGNIVNFIFIGNMRFKPNREGVLNFYNNYLKYLPKNYILNIVGPKSEEIKIKDIKVKKIGFVENLDKYMEKMDFGIATMMNGPGQKNKILDYLSRGLPTFINSFTNKANFFNSKYIYIADTPEEILKKIEEMKIIEKEKVKNSINNYSDYNSANKFWDLINNTIESENNNAK